MPSYLKDLEYKNPDEPENTLSHYATGTDFFAYLRNDAARLVRFNSAMKGAGQILTSPIPPTLLDSVAGEPRESVAMVDVGGGIGQVTEKAMEASPHVNGRFVVQDLGKIVDEARAKNPLFDVMEYDFFTPQPVKGTHANDPFPQPACLRAPVWPCILLPHAFTFFFFPPALPSLIFPRRPHLLYAPRTPRLS